jgi:hypothetical protein
MRPTKTVWAPVALILCISLATALVAALPALPPTAATGVPSGSRLKAPVVSDLRPPLIRVADTATRVPHLSDTARAYRGKSQTPAGETVDIRVSPSYSFDTAQVQRWADYLGSLLHGAELQSVVVYLAPLAEINQLCGPGAAACYSPREKLIVAPGEDLDAQTTAEALLTHEYGHHLANSSLNPPWNPLNYGTKRWASYLNVCQGAADGELFPGDEDQHYQLNPGEGFAEAYRVANQRRLGLAETPWQIVDQRFYPDANALALIEQDATQPWAANGSASYLGRFSRSGPSTRTFAVSTPLDGTVSASVRSPKGPSFRLTKAHTTVCGARRTNLTVRRVKGYGRFRLFVSRRDPTSSTGRRGKSAVELCAVPSCVPVTVAEPAAYLLHEPRRCCARLRFPARHRTITTLAPQRERSWLWSSAHGAHRLLLGVRIGIWEEESLEARM